MATFNGIPIADPSKKGLNFTTKEGFRRAVTSSRPDDDTRKSTVVEGVTSSTGIDSHFKSALKDPQLPHISEGDQEIDNNFVFDYESSKGFRIDETVTIPITSALRERIEDDQPVAQENESKANVEKSILEVDKNIKDIDINGGAFFNPKSAFPDATFKEELRDVFRIIRDPASKIANPGSFVDEKHYQTVITTDNSWTDPDTGRVHLFEKPRSPSRLA